MLSSTFWERMIITAVQVKDNEIPVVGNKRIVVKFKDDIF